MITLYNLFTCIHACRHHAIRLIRLFVNPHAFANFLVQLSIEWIESNMNGQAENAMFWHVSHTSDAKLFKKQNSAPQQHNVAWDKIDQNRTGLGSWSDLWSAKKSADFRLICRVWEKTTHAIDRTGTVHLTFCQLQGLWTYLVAGCGVQQMVSTDICLQFLWILHSLISNAEVSWQIFLLVLKAGVQVFLRLLSKHFQSQQSQISRKVAPVGATLSSTLRSKEEGGQPCFLIIQEVAVHFRTSPLHPPTNP